MAAGTFTVNSEIRIDAAPEAIFPFLTDPQKIVAVERGGRHGRGVPGGVYRVNVTGEARGRGVPGGRRPSPGRVHLGVGG